MSLHQTILRGPFRLCRSPLPFQYRIEHRTDGEVVTLSCWRASDLVLTALAEERQGLRAAGGRGSLQIVADAFGTTIASFPLDP